MMSDASRILFISAPFGGFFKSIARDLEAHGCQVWRTVCDGGEFIETPARNRILFRGQPGAWPAFIQRALRARRISAVVTFNDTSPRNHTALAVAREAGLSRFVLENGYLRPHWITFDRDGVNGNSTLPKDPDFYLAQQLPCPAAQEFPSRFRSHVWDTVRHFAASVVLSPALSFDSRYYGDSIYRQMTGYAREYAWGKVYNDVGQFERLVKQKAKTGGKIFVALLQKPGDGQLRVHSRFGSNGPFIEEICASFAAKAPSDAILVVKQHPLDYGVEKMPRRFKALSARLGLEGRAFYLRKTSIDKLLDHTHGLITINSTGGLIAVQRGIPTLCLGKAIYDMPGLTFQGPLDRFWEQGELPRRDVVAAFVAYLAHTSQLNGGFHTPQGLALLAPLLRQRILQGAYAPHQEAQRSLRAEAAPHSAFARPRLAGST